MYLNCKSYYSFRYGTFSTEELVRTAAEKGVSSLALTNINSTYDLWEFVRLCRLNDIKPVGGVEVRNEDTLLYLLLAANIGGLGWIHQFLSDHLIAKKKFPAPADDPSFFDAPADGFVIYPFDTKPFHQLKENERIGIKPWQINQLVGANLEVCKNKLVVWQPVTFANKTYFNLHRLLRAVDKNCLLSKLSPEAQADEREVFVAPSQLLQAFSRYPFIVTNTHHLLEQCDLDLNFSSHKNRSSYSVSPEDDHVLLHKLANDGFERRYGRQNKTAMQRLQKELKIINDMGFNSYFLINNDIVHYAQTRGFYHVGRGSGANSIVAYCLGITDVDPIELNLFFERFLNPHRTSPPDFDIDFSWTDRDEIIDYVFKRYGKDYVSLLGAYTTFKGDSII